MVEGDCHLSARVASNPSIVGIRRSISTSSGRKRWQSFTASQPSSASPTTTRSGHWLPDRARVWRVEQDDEWVEPGNSAIVNPRGELVAGPVAHEEKILLAEIDVNQVHARRRKFDSVGHYNRPDVFRLSIDASERRAVDALNWSDKNGRELENRLANYIPEAALGARCVSRHERVTARPASAWSLLHPAGREILAQGVCSLGTLTTV
jgi:hypothetical protein